MTPQAAARGARDAPSLADELAPAPLPTKVVFRGRELPPDFWETAQGRSRRLWGRAGMGLLLGAALLTPWVVVANLGWLNAQATVLFVASVPVAVLLWGLGAIGLRRAFTRKGL